MTGPAGTAALVEGIDVDAVAAAVRSCPAVDDLDSGRYGGVATYLPGRRVPGIRISDSRVEVHVRGVWNAPVATIASQIRSVLATLVGDKPIDIVLTDVADPGQAGVGPDVPTAHLPTTDTVEQWTTPSGRGEPSGATSSAPTIPTVAEIRPSS